MEPRKQDSLGCRRGQNHGRRNGRGRHRERSSDPVWSVTLACVDALCAGIGRSRVRPVEECRWSAPIRCSGVWVSTWNNRGAREDRPPCSPVYDLRHFAAMSSCGRQEGRAGDERRAQGGALAEGYVEWHAQPFVVGPSRHADRSAASDETMPSVPALTRSVLTRARPPLP
jgi:hypothetical protein